MPISRRSGYSGRSGLKMAYFIIKWNAGYGDTVEILECENQEEAQKYAYEQYREEMENQADYSAKPYSDEKAEEYDLTEEARDLGIYKGEEL